MFVIVKQSKIMKKLVLLLLLTPYLKTQSSGGWCIPGYGEHGEKGDFVYTLKNGHFPKIFYADEDSSGCGEGYDHVTDDKVAEMCKLTPARPGCFDKNENGNIFCKDYKSHHNRDLEGGTCSAREWDSWGTFRPYVVVNVANDDEILKSCTVECERMNGGHLSDVPTSSKIQARSAAVDEHGFRKTDMVDKVLCHCKPKLEMLNPTLIRLQ